MKSEEPFIRYLPQDTKLLHFLELFAISRYLKKNHGNL